MKKIIYIAAIAIAMASCRECPECPGSPDDTSSRFTADCDEPAAISGKATRDGDSVRLELKIPVSLSGLEIKDIMPLADTKDKVHGIVLRYVTTNDTTHVAYCDDQEITDTIRIDRKIKKTWQAGETIRVMAILENDYVEFVDVKGYFQMVLNTFGKDPSTFCQNEILMRYWNSNSNNLPVNPHCDEKESGMVGRSPRFSKKTDGILTIQ